MAKKTKEEPSIDELDATALTKTLIRELNKDNDAGKIAWCLGTDEDNPTEVKEFIPFGSTLLGYAACNRAEAGAPVGKLTEICGDEASGKSLICAHMIAETQRRGGLAVYIDTENSANPDFLMQLGVDINKLVYSQPGTVEEVGDAIEKVILMTRAKAPNRLVTIIWDGIAGTPCKCEIEGNYELKMDAQLEKSKVLGRMMRKLTQVWGKERICMVFTNQVRTKIGSMYGDPDTTPGGKAVPFHASLRIKLSKSSVDTDEKTKRVMGIHTRAKVIKTRLGPPLRACYFEIKFDKGIDDVGSWFEYLHEMGDITKSDGWCYYTSFKGKENPKHVEWGHMFREKQWNAEVEGNPEFKKHVLARLDQLLVVKYGEKPKDQIIDPESLMEAEAVQELVAGG